MKKFVTVAIMVCLCMAVSTLSMAYVPDADELTDKQKLEYGILSNEFTDCCAENTDIYNQTDTSEEIVGQAMNECIEEATELANYLVELGFTEEEVVEYFTVHFEGMVEVIEAIR